MAYYYVRNDGTATADGGRYASQQTGDWDTTLGATTNFYASISAAFSATTAPVAGDYILVSDIHDHSYTTNQTWAGTETAPMLIVCVDDTNIENARSVGRGIERFNSSSDLTINGRAYVSGLEFIFSDNFFPNYDVTMNDCKLELTGAGGLIAMSADQRTLTLVNSEVAISSATATVSFGGGGRLMMYGGLFSGATIDDVLSGSINGGMSAELIGVDLSASAGNIVGSMGNSHTGDDAIQVRIHRCKINASATLVEESFSSNNQEVLFTECSSSSSDAEHQIYYYGCNGTVTDDTTIRRADDEPFTDSAADISYKIVSNTFCNLGSPLKFDYPTPQYSALATATTDTLRFYVASTATLTDKDIYVELIYPDGTNKQTPNLATSAPTTLGGSIDVMASGTTLTTDSGSDWRNGASALAGYNEYYFDVDTSGDIGADCVPICRVYVTKASTTIYLASEHGVVA